MKINFNTTSIEKLEIKNKRYEIGDLKTPYLTCRVFPSGEKAFCYYRNIEGKPTRHKIGKFPDTPVHIAQRKAIQITTDFTLGKDPFKSAGLVTYNELFKSFHKNHSVPFKRSAKRDLQLHNIQCLPLHNVPIEKIDFKVAQWFANLGKTEIAKGTQNRALALVKSVINYAIRYKLCDGLTPIQIKKHKTFGRIRFFTLDEQKRFLEALEAEDHIHAKAFFYLLAYTGQRTGSLKSAKWKDIDWENKIWNIPPPKAKAGNPIRVPLSDQAYAIFKQLDEMGHYNEYIFFSTDSKSGHLMEYKKWGWRLFERAGITDFRNHDLRHNLASQMISQGASLFIVGKALGHKDTRSTEIYAHLADQSLRKGIQSAVNEIEEK